MMNLDAYADLLRTLLGYGYSDCNFSQAQPDKTHLIIRHDVDFSLQNAVEMAQMESGLGVSATYFVLVRSDIYNPFSGSSRRALHALVELGHRIGVHLDATQYPWSIDELRRGADEERALLEIELGCNIEMVSFHRPALGVLHDRSRLLDPMRHAYEACWMDDIEYCSDSGGKWKHGHPLEREAVRARRAMQLLTHPIWWVGEPMAPVDKVQRFVEQRKREFEMVVAANTNVWRP